MQENQLAKLEKRIYYILHFSTLHYVTLYYILYIIILSPCYIIYYRYPIQLASCPHVGMWFSGHAGCNLKQAGDKGSWTGMCLQGFPLVADLIEHLGFIEEPQNMKQHIGSDQNIWEEFELLNLRKWTSPCCCELCHVCFGFMPLMVGQGFQEYGMWLAPSGDLLFGFLLLFCEPLKQIRWADHTNLLNMSPSLSLYFGKKLPVREDSIRANENQFLTNKPQYDRLNAYWIIVREDIKNGTSIIWDPLISIDWF